MYLARQAYGKNPQLAKFLAVSMVLLANGSPEGHQQRTVLGKEELVRLGKAKMPKLR